MNNIAPINKGIPVLEVEGKNKTNFLSGIFLRWLKDVANRLNRAVVTDANGNIAYGNAIIPSDVADGYFHIFYPNGAVRIINQVGNIYDLNNTYIRDDVGTPRWQYITSGVATYVQQIESSSQKTQRLVASDNGGKLPSGSGITWVTVNVFDANGNVNIKTGSTYTATL